MFELAEGVLPEEVGLLGVEVREGVFFSAPLAEAAAAELSFCPLGTELPVGSELLLGVDLALEAVVFLLRLDLFEIERLL